MKVPTDKVLAGLSKIIGFVLFYNQKTEKNKHIGTYNIQPIFPDEGRISI